MNKKSMTRLFATLFLVILTAGCATDLGNIKQDYAIDYNVNKSLVFGEIEFKEFKYNIHETLYMNWIRFEDKRDFNIGITKSTYWQRLFPNQKKASVYFFLELPPGRFMFKEIKMADWCLWWPGINITVPEEPSLIYVGTLEIAQSGKKNFWSSETPITLNIADNHVAAKEILKERYPYITNNVSIQIMKRQALSYTPELSNKETLKGWEKEYAQNILKKINEKSYIYYNSVNESKAIVNFTVKDNGKISKINVDEEKSIDDRYLRKLAIKAVKRAAPFGKFPEDSPKEQIEFSIVIDFKLKDFRNEESDGPTTE